MLLAGAAFAVGARRQVRELGLIAANGGTAKHVGRTVLAQGLVLGLLGAVGGLLFGGVVIVRRRGGCGSCSPAQLIDGWRFGWVELTVAGRGRACCPGSPRRCCPAIGVARMRPVDALAQRFRSTALGARLPILGVVLLGVGIAGVLGVGRAGPAAGRGLPGPRWRDGRQYSSPDLSLPTIGVLAGGLVAVVGIIMITSGLVATLARMRRPAAAVGPAGDARRGPPPAPHGARGRGDHDRGGGLGDAGVHVRLDRGGRREDPARTTR